MLIALLNHHASNDSKYSQYNSATAGYNEGDVQKGTQGIILFFPLCCRGIWVVDTTDGQSDSKESQMWVRCCSHEASALFLLPMSNCVLFPFIVHLKALNGLVNALRSKTTLHWTTPPISLSWHGGSGLCVCFVDQVEHKRLCFIATWPDYLSPVIK